MANRSDRHFFKPGMRIRAREAVNLIRRKCCMGLSGKTASLPCCCCCSISGGGSSSQSSAPWTLPGRSLAARH